MSDPRLGFRDANSVTMPEWTVGGQPYNPSNVTAQMGLTGGYFVILDASGAPDEAVLDELRTLIAPKAAKKAKPDEPA